MLYLFQVYALVAAAVFLPLLLLYLAVAVTRIGVSTMLLIIRSLKKVSVTRTGFSRERWSLIHR
jgi:hypothetical protein